MTAIETGGDIPTLVERLKTQQTELAKVDKQLATVVAPPVAADLRAALKRKIRGTRAGASALKLRSQSSLYFLSVLGGEGLGAPRR